MKKIIFFSLVFIIILVSMSFVIGKSSEYDSYAEDMDDLKRVSHQQYLEKIKTDITNFNSIPVKSAKEELVKRYFELNAVERNNEIWNKLNDESRMNIIKYKFEENFKVRYPSLKVPELVGLGNKKIKFDEEGFNIVFEESDLKINLNDLPDVARYEYSEDGEKKLIITSRNNKKITIYDGGIDSHGYYMSGNGNVAIKVLKGQGGWEGYESNEQDDDIKESYIEIKKNGLEINYKATRFQIDEFKFDYVDESKNGFIKIFPGAEGRLDLSSDIIIAENAKVRFDPSVLGLTYDKEIEMELSGESVIGLDDDSKFNEEFREKSRIKLTNENGLFLRGMVDTSETDKILEELVIKVPKGLEPQSIDLDFAKIDNDWNQNIKIVSEDESGEEKVYASFENGMLELTRSQKNIFAGKVPWDEKMESMITGLGVDEDSSGWKYSDGTEVVSGEDSLSFLEQVAMMESAREQEELFHGPLVNQNPDYFLVLNNPNELNDPDMGKIIKDSRVIFNQGLELNFEVDSETEISKLNLVEARFDSLSPDVSSKGIALGREIKTPSLEVPYIDIIPEGKERIFVSSSDGDEESFFVDKGSWNSQTKQASNDGVKFQWVGNDWKEVNEVKETLVKTPLEVIPAGKEKIRVSSSSGEEESFFVDKGSWNSQTKQASNDGVKFEWVGNDWKEVKESSGIVSDDYNKEWIAKSGSATLKKSKTQKQTSASEDSKESVKGVKKVTNEIQKKTSKNSETQNTQSGCYNCYQRGIFRWRRY